MSIKVDIAVDDTMLYGALCLDGRKLARGFTRGRLVKNVLTTTLDDGCQVAWATSIEVDHSPLRGHSAEELACGIRDCEITHRDDATRVDNPCANPVVVILLGQIIKFESHA